MAAVTRTGTVTIDQNPTVYAVVVLDRNRAHQVVSQVVVAFESSLAAHSFALARGLAGYGVGPIVFDEDVPA